VAAGSRLGNAVALGKGAAVGVLSSVVPYSAELRALRRLAPSVFGILTSLAPAIACLAGWLLLGQTLAPRQLVAVAMVVVASAGATRTLQLAVPVDD
jgi:inner membrane transporter RhtA